MLLSTHVSRASSLLLLIGGLAMLFAADDILPRLIPNVPAAGAWLGQLLAAAWLGVAALNWLSRSVLLGGIYGRPVVAANAVLYFITATVLLKIVRSAESPVTIWVLFVPSFLFAAIYAWLLYRGPFQNDLEVRRPSQPPR